MSKAYDYMIMASKHSQSDGDLWLRYLYKVIQDEQTKLTSSDVDRLQKSPVLSIYQKITLLDALQEGTNMREHVLKANRKTPPKDIIKLFKEGKYGQKDSI